MCPWARSRPSGPVPFTVVMLWAWAFMFESKPCAVSLGLEPSLRAGSLYRCDALGLAFMFESKPWDASLGLEPSLRAGSFSP